LTHNYGIILLQLGKMVKKFLLITLPLLKPKQSLGVFGCNSGNFFSRFTSNLPHFLGQYVLRAGAVPFEHREGEEVMTKMRAVKKKPGS